VAFGAVFEMNDSKGLIVIRDDRSGTYDPVADNVQLWRPVALAMAAAVVGMLFVACSDAKPVNYYMGHAQERADKIRACLGQGSGSADCENARQAEFQVLGIPAVNGKAAQQ
jgi:hypothetical protein